jgi:hypothetical protein
MLAVAVYAIGRLTAARLWDRRLHYDINVAHVLMGTAMSGMLVSALNLVRSGVWEVVFGAVAVWFSWTSVRFVARHGVRGRDDDHVHHVSHYVTHTAMAFSMLYMYLAAAPAMSGQMSGMGTSAAIGGTANVVWLPLLFVMVLFASATWELDGAHRLVELQPRVAQAGQVPTVPPPSSGLARSRVSTGPVAEERSSLTGSNDDRLWLAPRLEVACHIAMCITMGYVLILMW